MCSRLSAVSLENKGKYLISHTQRPAYLLCRNGIYFFHLFLLTGLLSALTGDHTDERTDPVGGSSIMLRVVARCPYVDGGNETTCPRCADRACRYQQVNSPFFSLALFRYKGITFLIPATSAHEKNALSARFFHSVLSSLPFRHYQKSSL